MGDISRRRDGQCIESQSRRSHVGPIAAVYRSKSGEDGNATIDVGGTARGDCQFTIGVSDVVGTTNKALAFYVSRSRAVAEAMCGRRVARFWRKTPAGSTITLRNRCGESPALEMRPVARFGAAIRSS